MVKLIISRMLAVIFVTCLLYALVLPAFAAGNDTTVSESSYGIRGYVLDRYGTGVPGAEIRLTTADDTICMIPDNPMLSATGESGAEGYFEYRGVPPGNYTIVGTNGEYSCSVAITVRGDAAYVELTLPEYIHQHSADATGVSTGTSLATPVTSSEQSSDNAPSSTERTLPDMWHLLLGGCIVIAGALTAGAILKKG